MEKINLRNTPKVYAKSPYAAVSSARTVPPTIRLVVGIGNPHTLYANTYHNAGVIFADYLLHNHFLSNALIILKSNVAMNESGVFIKQTLRQRRIKPEALLIVHDDSDIALGSYKLSFGRGAAGHKGVQSVIAHLGTKNFWRLRLGVRNPKNRAKALEFVLRPITREDKKILLQLFERVAKNIFSSFAANSS